jgi:hypothetical protein
MTLRGMGRHTKLVASGLTMTICGGAIWPTISWALLQGHDGNDRYVMRVSVAIYTAMLVIVATINLHPTARHWVDAGGKTASIEARQDMPGNTVEEVSGGTRPHGSDSLPHKPQPPEHVEFARSDPRVS